MFLTNKSPTDSMGFADISPLKTFALQNIQLLYILEKLSTFFASKDQEMEHLQATMHGTLSLFSIIWLKTNPHFKIIVLIVYTFYSF